MTNKLIPLSKSQNPANDFSLRTGLFVIDSKRYAQNEPICFLGIDLLPKNLFESEKYGEHDALCVQ